MICNYRTGLHFFKTAGIVFDKSQVNVTELFSAWLITHLIGLVMFDTVVPGKLDENSKNYGAHPIWPTLTRHSGYLKTTPRRLR